MTIAPIIAMIAPARAADSAPTPAQGGFAALLSGQAQPVAAVPVVADAVLPELASAAGRLKQQGEVAPQPALSLAPETPAAPVQEAQIADLPEEIAIPDGEVPAPQPSDPQQPKLLAEVQPNVPATSTAAPTVPLPLATAEAVAPPAAIVPVKGIKDSKADRSEKAGQSASSSAKEQPRLAETMLPVMPMQDQAVAAKPLAAPAATTLMTPQPVALPEGETPPAAEEQSCKSAGHVQVAAAATSTPQASAIAARQEVATPADRLIDGAASPANGVDPTLSAPVSRPVAFSDVYAVRPQAAPSPVVAAQAGTIGREMGVEIARHVTAGRSEMIVRLDPPEMGRIDIRLSFNHDGGLRAVMSADNQGALDLLRRETGDLTRALSDAGVKADAQSFRFDSRGGEAGQRGQPQQQHQPGQHGREPGHGRNGIADEQPLYRALRASGRVDLMA